MSEDLRPLEGRCLCGAVTLTAIPAEAEMHACHCDMCRAWTGAMSVSIKVAPGRLTETGPVKRRQTSPWAERAWCEDCGSSLYYRVTAPGPMQGQSHVSSGLFPDAGGLRLASEIYIDRKPRGYAFAGDLPSMTKAEVEAMFAASAGES